MRKIMMTLCAALLAAGLFAADTLKLEPRWPIGKKAILKTTMENVTEMTNAPMPIGKQVMTMEQEYSVSFLEKTAAGLIVSESEFLSLKMTMNMGKTTMSFDSKKDKPGASANNPFAFIGSLVGKKFKVTMTANGKTVKVEGLKELFAGMPANPITRNFLSDENLSKMCDTESLFSGLNGKSVKVGDTWKQDEEFDLGPLGKTKLALTYRYAGEEKRLDRELAALKFSGKVDIDLGGKAFPQGMSVRAKDSEMSGTSWYDPALGMIVDAELTQKIPMRMEMPAAPNAKAGAEKKTIDMVVHTKVRNTIEKIGLP